MMVAVGGGEETLTSTAVDGSKELDNARPTKRSRKAKASPATVTAEAPMSTTMSDLNIHEASGKGQVRASRQKGFTDTTATRASAVLIPHSRKATTMANFLEDDSRPAREAVHSDEDETGASIIAGCRVKKTVNRYNALNKRLVQWLKLRHATLVDNDKITLPLPSEDARAYPWFMTIKCDKRGEPLVPRQFTSASHIGNASSALVYLRKEVKVDMPQDLCTTLKSFGKGYCRKVGTLKQEGDMAIQEGKHPITKQGLFYLARRSTEALTDPQLHMLVHCFLTMCWNLMARAVSCATILFDHVTWLGPQAVQVWLRAGWSLGSVQSRYIFQGSGGDEFIGRAATCLDVNDASFASLPPHFAAGEAILTDAEWNYYLPGYGKYFKSSFCVALLFLLASLAYHCEWLQATLPVNHPLRASRVWTLGLLSRLQPLVHA
ncbi:hypothetical protein LEN26_002289, partial [Aphanomyces euteiches]